MLDTRQRSVLEEEPVRFRTVRWAGPMTVAILAACAIGRAAPQQLDGNVITAGELACCQAATAWEAIKRLRPLFLRTRGPASILVPGTDDPAVYVDYTFMGGLDALRDLPTSEVEEIRYVSAWDAATRFGIGHPQGVIEVMTRRGP